MITGYLLLGSERELNYSIALRKYALRIFLALTIFSLPFAVLKIYGETHSISVGAIFKAYIENESLAHLWYLYALIGLYLVAPILKEALKKLEDHTIACFLALMVIFEFFVPMLSNVFNIKVAFGIPLKYPVFYFVAGYYCRRLEGREKVNMVLARSTAVLGFLLIAALIIWGRFTFVSDNYASPLIAVTSMALFLIGVRQKNFEIKGKWQSFFWKVDRLCFAVYLIHPIFIQTSYRVLKRTPIDYGAYPLFTVFFFLFFVVLSFGVASFVVKFPGLKKILL
jgi:surface polysaccharide O-acyltransferase-like enzyme